MKSEVLILEKPKIAIPNSSGKGEAMMKPPIKKVSHLKYFRFKRCLNIFCPPFFLSSSIRCLENLSFMNLKMMRSPIVAPRAPNTATIHTGLTCAISPKVTIAGTVVKAEVKNIPAAKLPNISKPLVEIRICSNNSVLARNIAKKMLNIMMTRSVINKYVALDFIP